MTTRQRDVYRENSRRESHVLQVQEDHLSSTTTYVAISKVILQSAPLYYTVGVVVPLFIAYSFILIISSIIVNKSIVRQPKRFRTT